MVFLHSLIMGILCPWCLVADAAHGDDASGYAIVVSENTAADPGWAKVVDALAAKHGHRGARVVRYDGDMTSAAATLRREMPAFNCFVARPEEATRGFVMAVHQFTRGLDDDPYTDTLWGILTGFDAANALAIARRTEPLEINNVTSGTEVSLDRVGEGVWFSESTQNRMVVKPRGGEPRQARADDDTTAAIAARLNDGQTDLFITSGHATERDWQIGFTFRNGSFRSRSGSLTAVDTAGHQIPIRSDNPKAWLPIGNCLAGHIDGPDALALAFMKAAGVHQMIGYTVPTWYGYAGWGCLDYFFEQPGRYTLAEAFHANGHALVHRLATLEATGGAAVDLRGLRFDRDVVAFYGDPAWEVRMAPGPCNYSVALRDEPQADGGSRLVLQITPLRGKDSFLPASTNGSQRGGRPIVAFFPRRLANATVREGADRRAVVTDRFVLVPAPGSDFDGQPFRIVITGDPAACTTDSVP